MFHSLSKVARPLLVSGTRSYRFDSFDIPVGEIFSDHPGNSIIPYEAVAVVFWFCSALFRRATGRRS